MAITLLASIDMWSDKNHSPSVSSFDQIELYAHFDQPIVHELEYMEQEVTDFWINVFVKDEHVSMLRANKVLAELMDEAKNFKNGKFKFSLSKLPDALTQHFHAAFAQKMCMLSEGNYPVRAVFNTNNPLQVGKVLAEVSFNFVLEPGSKEHLQKIAEENLANGADQVEDALLKMEKFANINKSAEKHSEVNVTFVNKGSEEIWVMVGYNSGKKFSVPDKKSVTLSVPSLIEFFKLIGTECSTNFGSVSGKRKEELIEVY